MILQHRSLDVGRARGLCIFLFVPIMNVSAVFNRPTLAESGPIKIDALIVWSGPGAEGRGEIYTGVQTVTELYGIGAVPIRHE